MTSKPKKVYYLTFNDAPGGIFQSQVIDVIKLYRSQKIDANLIAIISLRNFFNQRKIIKTALPSSFVFPAFPKLKYWKLNALWFYFIPIAQSSIIIARNIIACNLALRNLKSKCEIVYDGRGAIKAEQEEYNVYRGTGIENQIEQLERCAVLNARKRIAVSDKLLNYWKEVYDFNGNHFVVIPCTLSLDFSKAKDLNRMNELKSEFGIKENDITFIYSGSIAEWQSFDTIGRVLNTLLSDHENSKLIFLAKEHKLIQGLIDDFPGRVFQRFVPHKNVVDYLDISDYGLLLREKSITNQVASPVKCAEYLSRGLKVLISPEIGDYSEQIEKNDLGVVIDINEDLPQLVSTDKQGPINYAERYLSKKSRIIIDKYLALLEMDTR